MLSSMGRAHVTAISALRRVMTRECWLVPTPDNLLLGAGAVEMGLGKVMNNWIVHDHHDVKVLQQLSQGLRAYQFRANACSFDLPPHNLTAFRQPPAHLRTLLRVSHDFDRLGLYEPYPASQMVTKNSPAQATHTADHPQLL